MLELRCINFREGSSEPKKDAQVIRVRGVVAPGVFELKLLRQPLYCFHFDFWYVTLNQYIDICNSYYPTSIM